MEQVRVKGNGDGGTAEGKRGKEEWSSLGERKNKGPEKEGSSERDGRNRREYDEEERRIQGKKKSFHPKTKTSE